LHFLLPLIRPPPRLARFPYTTLFRSSSLEETEKITKEEETPAPTATAANAENVPVTDAASAAESPTHPTWMPWLIVAGVAVLVLVIISSLLLLRSPSGRGRHAAR